MYDKHLASALDATTAARAQFDGATERTGAEDFDALTRLATTEALLSIATTLTAIHDRMPPRNTRAAERPDMPAVTEDTGGEDTRP